MNLLLSTFTLLLFGSSICFVQESQETVRAPETEQAEEPMKEVSQTGFDWLKQFEGTWTVTSWSPEADRETNPGQSTTMTGRAIGRNWMVNEQNGQMGTMMYQSIQTLGYDNKTEKFVGTWIDSMSDFTWQYDGSLDETGKSLLLEADGPDWRGTDKIIPYRDVFEVVSENEFAHQSQYRNDDGEWQAFIVSSITRNEEVSAPPVEQSPITPFLMFQGKGTDALALYETVFDDLQIESMAKYSADGQGKEGTIERAVVVIAGQRVNFFDSPIPHDFDFTPSFSFFVECESEEQLHDRFNKLSKGGNVRMPVNNYGFSRKFAWVSDEFGVSWQLNLN